MVRFRSVINSQTRIMWFSKTSFKIKLILYEIIILDLRDRATKE